MGLVLGLFFILLGCVLSAIDDIWTPHSKKMQERRFLGGQLRTDYVLEYRLCTSKLASYRRQLLKLSGLQEEPENLNYFPDVWIRMDHQLRSDIRARSQHIYEALDRECPDTLILLCRWCVVWARMETVRKEKAPMVLKGHFAVDPPKGNDWMLGDWDSCPVRGLGNGSLIHMDYDRKMEYMIESPYMGREVYRQIRNGDFR